MSKIQNVTDISLVIPTYNRCELLKRAINSVLNQTINVRETIIVDNGSTDNTHEMISSLFPEITYIYEKRNVRGYQKWYSHASKSQIQKYKYRKTLIHKYSICLN